MTGTAEELLLEVFLEEQKSAVQQLRPEIVARGAEPVEAGAYEPG